MTLYFNSYSSTKRKRNKRYQPNSEMNVVPFIDVMLVLLVIFMVAAPLMTVGVKVELPEANAKTVNESEEPLVVSINNSGDIYLQDTKIEFEKFLPRLQAITNNNYDIRIFVRGDRALNYGRIMQVMGELNSAGFNKIALIAELPKS